MRITDNINKHAINPLAAFVPFAEFGAFVCVFAGAALVCVPDPDPLFPALVVVVVEVVIELEVDTVAELEVDTFVELDLLADTAKLGTAAPTTVGSTKPQAGAAGAPVEPTHTSITH